jgi:hypothetical protein
MREGALTLFQDAETIRTLLKIQPVSLPHNLWEVLKKNGHVRTPEEHLHHLLHNAPVSELEETLYSSGVKRALSAALALDDKTKRLRLIFKSGAKSELNQSWTCFLTVLTSSSMINGSIFKRLIAEHAAGFPELTSKPATFHAIMLLTTCMIMFFVNSRNSREQKMS